MNKWNTSSSLIWKKFLYSRSDAMVSVCNGLGNSMHAWGIMKFKVGKAHNNQHKTQD